MSEKVRALNLTAGNMSMLTTTGAGGGVGGITLIGAPTLISSTFTATATQSLTPTATATAVGGNSPIPTPPPTTLLHLSQHHQQNSGGSDTESSSEFAPGAIMAQLNFHLLQDLSTAGGAVSGGGGVGSATGAAGGMSDSNSIMNTSQISATSNDSIAFGSASPAAAGGVAALKASNGKHLAAQSVAGKSCRFPKLEECAHFHYERVQLGPLAVRLVDDKSELLNSSIASQSIGGDIANGQSSTGSTGGVGVGGSSTTGVAPANYRSFSPSSCWFIIKVMPHRTDPFLVRRSFDNMQMLDEMLHRCVYDRKISGLRNLNDLDFKSEEDVEYAVAKYLERFSKIASDSLTCGTILTWFQLDNKGRRLPLADGDTMRSINTPAVGAAYGVRRYMAQASDEISIEVGDMISVIDMPSPAESIWWRGKKSHLQKSHYEVGFFPQSCVATIGDKVPRHFPMPAPLVGQLDVSPTKPVLRKHGKLIAFFRSFILSRPSRRRLKQSGIYRERVFSCDLSEHLLNSGQEIPMVLRCCAEFLEDYGIVDGIYRLSGITSNIQRLRRAFDEERIPDLGNPEMKQDIHAVSSLLKMYFRELPNPLCTYQLYDNFVEAIQEKSESNERLRLMKETVLKLPPPHYRTLKYLATHLNKISQHSARTGMTDKNLAIVWAPNLLRSPALESGGVAALRGVGVQAVVTEYLIRNCHLIFDALDDSSNARLSYIATVGATPGTVNAESRMDSLTDCESLLVEQREHDQSLTFVIERPKSLSASGPKLISLEEAQERHSRLDGYDMNKSMPINMTANNAAANIGSYIEVGGGPSSLPDKYHTVLPVPRSWQKRKTHSWKSLFSRNQRSSTDGSSGKNELKSSLSPSGADVLPTPHYKEATQVTFAESDAIITHGSGGKSGKSLLKHTDKTKSIELYDSSRGTDSFSKPMEICVRSSSIDSLRTAGHSRSVSHDSYFDLLQSPQRGHMATTCPSRELSELGLNFDREEPEMRIFSESESLVSSPRVGKENIPPTSTSATTSRRILRARPEEFSTSQTNSVNPSPKKQPRLNLRLSPSQQNWSQSSVTPGKLSAECNDVILAHGLSGDESCCKRYKLEDQLSDIQFIDCSTPEHTIAVNSPTQTQVYTSVQIHNPPKSSLSKNSLYSSSNSESASKILPDNELSTPTPTPAQSSHINGVDTFSSTYEALFGGKGAAADLIASRYSYPTVQLGAKRKDQENKALHKERFSYPGSDSGSVLPPKDDAQVKNKLLTTRPETIDQTQTTRTVSFSQHETQHQHSQQAANLHHLPKPVPELLRPKNRYSYCDTSSDSSNAHHRHSALTQHQLNLLLLRSNSTELTKPPRAQQQQIEALERMRHSEMTPSSPPTQSPRYSLLVGGDTSSENSSAVNTPQYDLEPLMLGSTISGMSGISGHSSGQQQQLLAAESISSSIGLGASRESLGLNHMLPTERRDMHALKRELSLDLKNSTNAVTNNCAKMCIDHADGASTLPAKLQLQHQLIPSPNNSNFTDNTSQSVTPSEYGYQQLQRQSSLHSSFVETAENSPNYEEYENTPSNLISPLSNEGSDMTSKLLTASQSPIKSTISITYNLKSPVEESNSNGKPFPALREKPKRTPRKQPLLETSFDEHTVYEQVKLFRNSVTEVNQLLNNDSCRKSISELQNLKEEEESLLLSAATDDAEQVELSKYDEIEEHKKDIFTLGKEIEESNNLITLSDEDELLNSAEDVDMRHTTAIDERRLLYENVELRKPKSFYENISGEDMKANNDHAEVEEDNLSEKLELELDSLDSIKSCDESSKSETATSNDVELLTTARKSPSNFSVKQLANKFESSPVEQMPAFDFSVRSSVKKHATVGQATADKSYTSPTNTHQSAKASNSNKATLTTPSNNHKQTLTKTQQITRSLDENAFVREFGAKQLLDLATKSTQQLPEYESVAVVVANRRKSYDFTRPKTLNPPKRLPGMPITEEICTKSMSAADKPPTSPHMKLDLQKREKIYNHAPLEQQDFERATELKITPTSENRISLIQNNVSVTLPPHSTEHLSNSNSNLASLNSLKVLSGVKLDRERIDKIKEERRQQLTQKYRAESFKSRSKTDLNSPQKEDDVRFHAESLRVKSKSRGDMRTLQKDIDNLKEFGRSAVGSTGSETTLHQHYTQAQQQQQRVRSISDEKNQNCEVVPSTVASRQSTKLSAQRSPLSNTTNSSDSSSASDDYSKRVSSQRASAAQDEYSARATVQKFERKSLDYANGGNGSVSVRDRRGGEVNSGSSMLSATHTANRSSLSSTREKISPQFSIRDVTAMFESRSQNQQ